MEMNTLRRKIKETYRKTQNWQKTADEWGLKKGTVYKIAMYPDYEPKDHVIRHHLGLPALVEVPPCSKCGSVHLTKRCVANSRNGRKPPWYKMEESYPSKERMDRVLRGWVD